MHELFEGVIAIADAAMSVSMHELRPAIEGCLDILHEFASSNDGRRSGLSDEDRERYRQWIARADFSDNSSIDVAAIKKLLAEIGKFNGCVEGAMVLSKSELELVDAVYEIALALVLGLDHNSSLISESTELTKRANRQCCRLLDLIARKDSKRANKSFSLATVLEIAYEDLD